MPPPPENYNSQYPPQNQFPTPMDQQAQNYNNQYPPNPQGPYPNQPPVQNSSYQSPNNSIYDTSNADAGYNSNQNDGPGGGNPYYPNV